MKANSTVVETRDLVKTYGDGVEVRALDGVTMKVWEGEMVAVMGPSGSGKSTLLHLLGALDQPTNGQAIVNGQDLATVKNLDQFRAKTVGFIFQLHNLIPTLTALENVQVPLYETKMGAHARKQRARELLALVGLAGRESHLPNMLSGGERQRVAVARALANEPTIILADEPTGELDSESSREIIDLMHQLNHDLGTTFIIVTHDLNVARRTARILMLDSGRVVREHITDDPYVEDLRILKDSPLGQALLDGKVADLTVGGLTLYRQGKPTDAGRAVLEMLEAV